MNVYAKRPRLYSSHQRDFPPSFSNQHEYYDEPDEPEGMEEGEDEEEALDYDPHTELQQRRAELDNRLKNTFESIFAKYERDFDGIGDEIDLATGEIVVNNGHLIDMMNEKDSGLRNARRELVDDSEGIETSTEEDESLEDEDDESEDGGEEVEDEEVEEDEEDEDDQDTTTGESMDDDDLILRGFTQANRFLQASPELGMSADIYTRPPIPRHESKPKHRRSLQTDALHSHSDILAQFGPQLGPQIVGYISQQEEAKESHIEPAWRVPDIPSITRKKKPIQAPFANARQLVRSLSPEASASVWAIPGMQRKQKSGPSGFSGSVQSKRIRNGFTQEQDEAMLEYVAKARQKGTPLFSALLWKGLEAKHPIHSWTTWQSRYRRNFYLSNDSDLSAVESTISDAGLPQAKKSYLVIPPQEKHERPNRERKPAQRDSRIISWSEAVDTIASVDPDLHAGILDDARRAKNGDTSWVFGRHGESARSKTRPHVQPLNRPVSAHQVDEPQNDYSHSRHEPARRFSDSRIAVSELPLDQLPFKKPKPIARAPCPHANCRHLTATLYRLERVSDEDVSEMILHLLRDHHTTPFPCGEVDCLQKGENGYFMQEDLVNHVRSAHVSVAALHRLRGRVDPALLGRNEERVCIDLTQDSPGIDRKASRQMDSDFMRASNVPSNSDIISSTPGHDRTLTPVTFGERPGGGALPSTPLTSFSSLAVNRSSTTVQKREVSDSQEPSDLPTGMDAPAQSYQFPRDEAHEVGFLNSRVKPSGPIPSPQFRSKGPTSQPLGHSVASFLPQGAEGVTWLKSNVRVDDLHHNNISEGSSPYLTPQANNRDDSTASTQVFPDKGSSMAPNISSSPKRADSISVRSIYERSGKNGSSHPIPPVAKKISTAKRPRASETFTRNIIPSSHEFSDEESPMPPPKAVAPPTPAHFVGSLGVASVPPPVTPTTKRKAPKSIVQKAQEQEDDLDELSLGPDDFKIISSLTKSLPQSVFGSHMGIKREGTVGPGLSSVPATRKRKYSDVAGSDEVDELGADECFGKSSGTRIKKEVDLNGTPMVHRIKAQRKQAKKTYRDEAKKGPMGLPPQLSSSIMVNRHIGRSGTPLLDLTPDRRGSDSFGGGREILDSEDSIPSSALRQGKSRPAPNAISRSPLDGLLTPTRSKQGSFDPSKLVNTAIVIKTPGGTYRKCGVGSFRCGRSFCFRCSHSEATVRN